MQPTHKTRDQYKQRKSYVDLAPEQTDLLFKEKEATFIDTKIEKVISVFTPVTLSKLLANRREIEYEKTRYSRRTKNKEFQNEKYE